MHKPVSSEALDAARSVFAYLAEVDRLPAEAADAVIGFGMFDLTLPKYCGALFRQHRAKLVIFTGGIGAGTADLGGPEADVWRETLLRADPAFPLDRLITENQSTNTTENIRFTASLLEREHATLAFGRGIKRVIIVASPSRLRRASLALRQWQPELLSTRSLPSADFAREKTLYERKGIDFLAHLTGELDRIVDYPSRGWIAAEPLPPPIAAAHVVLRSHHVARGIQ